MFFQSEFAKIPEGIRLSGFFIVHLKRAILKPYKTRKHQIR